MNTFDNQHVKVSIIMGVYNAEKTICQAIDSILNQTYQNWVFIICDDGSSDDTHNILKKYKKKYPKRFMILKNANNKGLSYSLNSCLRKASSEYVARMDADDISLPDRLKNQVEFLDSNPQYGFVGTAIERFDESGIWGKSVIKDSAPSKETFYWSSGFVHPTVLMRKKMLDNVGGYRDKWYTQRCEDYDLWMRLYAKGYKGYILKKILFQYYEGKESYQKRSYKYRICEAVVRAKGYASLGMYPKGIIFVFKPLAVGLLPACIIKGFHNQ